MAKSEGPVTRPAFTVGESRLMMHIVRHYQWPEDKVLEGAMLFEKLTRAFVTFLSLNGGPSVNSDGPVLTPEIEAEMIRQIEAQFGTVSIEEANRRGFGVNQSEEFSG